MSTAADIFKESLDWLFWPPAAPRVESAWLGHIPFAHWVVGAARPQLLVELGTHTGASYFAFCESVRTNGLGTRCFAVDTWEGDGHVVAYGEDVHAQVAALNSLNFAGFSTLLRKSFDAALADFADGSIDLLHIDGFHTYEAVSHDFTSWLPKLSDRAVVLFHDIAEQRDDFGVWRLWMEIAPRSPSFSFHHWHGLGVLQVGSDMPPGLAPLFALEDEAEADKVRRRFETLGAQVNNVAYAARLQAEVRVLRTALQQASAAHA